MADTKNNNNGVVNNNNSSNGNNNKRMKMDGEPFPSGRGGDDRSSNISELSKGARWMLEKLELLEKQYRVSFSPSHPVSV